MRSHERLYFYLKTQSIKCLFIFFYFETYSFILKLICFELYSLFYGTSTNVQAE